MITETNIYTVVLMIKGLAQLQELFQYVERSQL